MLPEHQAFSWLILCPMAIVTNCLAALTVTHYRRAYIGTDMIIICLLMTMAMNAGLLLIPAIFVMLNLQSWPHDFCLFYIWAFGFLRSMGLVGLFVLSFHWSYLSRMTPLHRVQTSSRPIICALIVIVLISVVVGLLPLVRMMMREAAGSEAFEESSSVILLSSIFDEKRQVCTFLTYDAEPALAIFIIILTLMVFLAMIICLTDSGILLHSYKIMFIVKYKSGGFYDPEQARSLWSQSGLVSDTYSELNNTFDLWRVVLLQFLLCTLLSHIPYVCIEFVQLFSRQVQTEVLMLTVQWLQVMEFSVFPLTLWLGGRYRHAFAHLCRQIFCCDDSACEEQNTCKLQSYRLKAHIREQRQKAVEAMEAKIAQAKGRGPVMVKGLSLTALANEPEGTSPQHESTVTEVQADVHAQSTPASRRSSTFQPGPVVRNSGPRISKGSPMVQRFAPTLKEEAASTTNATPLVNLVRPTPKPIEIGNTNNNNIAGAGEIRSKLSSPAISESESKITTLELYDDEDIDAGLDASPLPKEPPAEGRKPEAIEMRNVEREKCSQQSSATPDVGVTSRGNDEDKMLTSKKPAVFPKPQPKAEVKIWTSQSKTPPNAPSGISFDCQGGTGPYFEPVSDSSSVTSDEVSQPNILQAEHLSKSKTPYTRSESFLQAVSSSSAYGTISPKPASKFKLLTKIALKLRNLSVRSKQTKSDKLSDEGCKQSDSEGILDKFACGSDEKPGEAIQRCTLKDRPALDPNTKQFHVTDDDLASHEIIRKLRNYDSEDTEEEFADASSTTDDTRPFAAKKQKTKKTTPVTSKKSSKDNLGKELVASTAGVTNMAADLTDSPVKKPISTEVLAEHKIVKKLQFQSSSDSDGLAETPPTDAGNTGADRKQGKKKKTGAVGGSRSPQVPKRILPPKVIKKPIPPPPPPPPPLPPPKGHQYPGGMARINNTSESSRSVKSEASSVSVTGDESRFLRAGSEGQKRSSLITSDLLASHEIIKRLQNQAEKHSEPMRRPYTRVNLAPAKPLLPPPPLPPTPPLSKPTRATLAKPDTTGLVPSAVDSSGSGLGEQNTSGTEDEKPLIEVLSHTSSGRIYRSVSSESIFSHMENENKEFPSSLSKATDDLRVSHLSNPSSTALTLVSVGWLTDTRPDIFPTNLKDTNRCSRSTSDISASGHHSSYRPPVPPRTIPVQKVKSLQATMMEREQSSSPYSETSIRLQEAQNLSTEDQKMVKDKKADESTNTVALKDEPPRSLKILKKIEEELDSETSAKLRKDLGNVDTLKRSPVFMRRFHQELVARKLSDESTKSVFMPATKLKNSLTAAKDTPSSSNSKKINDGSSTALRKFLSEAVTERRLSEQSSVSSTSSSPIKTIEQDSGDKDSPQNNAEDKGHVDIKAAV